jgi:hypothetical protein
MPLLHLFRESGVSDWVGQIGKNELGQIFQRPDVAKRSSISLFWMILPFVVNSKLCLISDMDVFWEVVQIAPETILAGRWIELSIADFQVKIVFRHEW